jgi:predicted PurR-regulated permease PerM
MDSRNDKIIWNTLGSTDSHRNLFIIIFVATVLTICELVAFFYFIAPQIKMQVDQGIEIVVTNMRADIDRIKNYATKIYGIVGNEIDKQSEYVKNLIDNFVETETGQRLKNIYNESEIKSMELTIKSELEQSVDKNISTMIDRGFARVKAMKQIVKSIFDTLKSREAMLIDKINNYTKAMGIGFVAILCFIMYMVASTLINAGSGPYSQDNNNNNNGLTMTMGLTIGLIIGLIIIFQYIFYEYARKYQYLGSQGNDELVYRMWKNL